MEPEDPWDWPFLMYVGTVILRRTDKQFWRMSPRKLSALAKVHADINNPDGASGAPGGGRTIKSNGIGQPTAYIDQIMP